MKSIITSIFLIASFCCIAQKADKKHSKVSLDAGYGLAGSFFAKSLEEVPPFPTTKYRLFSKKKFLGNVRNASINYRLNKHYQLKAGINFQHFTRHVRAVDTISNVVITIDNTIHHRDYMYVAGIDRIFDSKKHLFTTGLGIYYVNPKREYIEYGYGIPNFIAIRESRNGHLEEAGVLTDLSYQYKFQPKVNIGIKAQLYYTLSASYFESVTLFPFIKINF